MWNLSMHATYPFANGNTIARRINIVKMAVSMKNLHLPADNLSKVNRTLQSKLNFVLQTASRAMNIISELATYNTSVVSLIIKSHRPTLTSSQTMTAKRFRKVKRQLLPYRWQITHSVPISPPQKACKEIMHSFSIYLILNTQAPPQEWH